MRALSDASQLVSDTGLAFERYSAVYDAQSAFGDKSQFEALGEIAQVVAGLLLDCEFAVHSVEIALQSRIGFHDAADVEGETYSKEPEVLLVV